MSSSAKFTTNLFIMFLFHSLATGSYSATFTIVNKCSLTVFPAIFHGFGTSLPSTTGFSLDPGESNVLAMPRSWSGRLWGRTHCSHHSNGNFSCLTGGGDCASSTMECNGGNASSPATFAEFNLNAKSSGFDFFRISLVNGYNLPMVVEPQVGNGSGNCTSTGCMVPLGTVCPSQLKVMSGGDCIGCRSACKPFSKHCSSKFFAKACPHAKVDATKTFQSVCATTDYFITFCPTSTRMEPSKEKNPTTVDNSGGQKKGSTKDKIVNFFLKNKKLLSIVGAGVGIVVVIVITISCACACTKHGCNCIFGLSAGIKSKLPHHLFESTKIEELFFAVERKEIERKGNPIIETTY
ncbi:pathogenesis-related thaumatin-like protein 3.5 isoform X2 [Trifolium pratense]|uniref:pathogenesis-related thaumatin-like protein 3.5 isoform X2 n=1 Tax=Trifolium pratense TaxID=57577 RepID=UPI001E697D9B|nr:pathogenesis-related thaumatin-like protein 3.5 isoform X2 [Trifolium pratense]